MNVADHTNRLRDAISSDSASEPNTHGPPDAEPESEALDDLIQERTTFYSRLETRCSWCDTPIQFENVYAGQRVACPRPGCHGGVTIGIRLVSFHTDIDRLPVPIELPDELAAAFQTDRPALAGWLRRALTAPESAAVGHAFGVLLAQNRRLGQRVQELEHHLDLLVAELGTQVSVTRGLEAALTRIHRLIRLPVDPEVWPAG